MKFILKPGNLTLADFRVLLDESTTLELDPSAIAPIQQSEKVIENILKQCKTVYGINTGFGLLANTSIKSTELKQLQRSIVLSHAAGTGELLSDQIVRLMLQQKYLPLLIKRK